jgi:hypothetical protein
MATSPELRACRAKHGAVSSQCECPPSPKRLDEFKISFLL